jgi:hypothetical protein
VNDYRGATFNLYGAGGKRQFMEEIDQGLADLGEQGRRAG